MATRNLATGILDIQLMGLPDVKRQLEGIPRLMDGVANAALDVRDRMREIFKEKYDAAAAVAAQLPPGTTMTMPSMKGVMEDETLKGMKKSFEHSREAITGDYSLELLGIERAVVQEIENELKAKGELDAVNQHIIATERERIRLSEQAINLERQRVMDPEAFRKGRMLEDVKQGFVGFEENKLHTDAIKKLDEREEALKSFQTTQGKTSSVKRAYIDQSLQEIATERKLLKAHAESGRELINHRDISVKLNTAKEDLRKKNMQGSDDWKKVTAAIRENDKAIDSAEKKHRRNTRHLNEFNQELKNYGDESKRANYRAQQLSFAAQDAVQVFGQTGFAGALHASANNLSMFVQTLDIANPKLLAWGAFGVTAGMMALSAWLHRTKSDAEMLANSFDKLGDRIEERTNRIHMLRDASADSASGLAKRIEEAGQTSRLAAEKRQAEVSRLAGESVYQPSTWSAFWDQFESAATDTWQDTEERLLARSRARKIRGESVDLDRERFLEGRGLGRRQGDSKARKEYLAAMRPSMEAKFDELVGATTVEAAKNILQGMGLSAEKVKEELDKFKVVLEEDRKAKADLAQLEKLASQSIGSLADLPFAESGKRLLFSIDRLADTEFISDDVKKAAISDQILQFSAPGMNQQELFNRDYAGAIARLTNEYQSTVAELRARRDKGQVDQRAIDHVTQMWIESIQGVRDEMDNLGETIRQSALQARREQMGTAISTAQFFGNDFNAKRMQVLQKMEQQIEAASAAGPVNLPAFERERDRKIAKIDYEEARAKLNAQALGRDGAGDPRVQAEIEEAKRAADALMAIAQSGELTAQEKKERVAIAEEVHKDNLADIKDRFQKIGFSDPKSLHRQIQMSLQRPPNEKVLKDQLGELKATNDHLTDIKNKLPMTIGP